MRRDVCNSGDVIGRGGFKRSSDIPWALVCKNPAAANAQKLEPWAREWKKEREGGRRKEMEKKKKKYGKKHELKSRATDNELSGSARFRAKIQWLNRVIKSRRRLTTTSRRLPFVRYPTQLSSVLLFASSVINREWLYN